MARRSGGNTLLNYFTRSPITTPTSAKRKSPEPEEIFAKTPKINDCSDSDEEITPVVSHKKRIRLLSEDSDKSDNENKDLNNTKSRLEESFKYEAKTASPNSIKTPLKRKKLDMNDSNSEVLSSPKSLPTSQTNDTGNWTHCQLDWLKPENIRDSEKRKMDHPEYDPRTLYVPPDFLRKQTPAHKQWWEMKVNHYDCVLFFKVGKFYELFHMDAAVGVNELGFSYMKGDFAHSGFPETAYGRMASTLVQKGYRVARVEQTETPDMMQERVKKMNLSTKEKAVRREVCQITCKGIEICGLQDSGPPDAAASYMLAVCEQDLDSKRSKYGICFIDTSIGTFHIGQFEDDRHSSRILTTMAHYPPVLILHERGGITDRMNKVLKVSCQSARKEILAPDKQFWSASQTLKTMAQEYYQKSSGTEWPAGFTPFLSKVDTLGLMPSEDYELAIRALGACIWYLKQALLDIQIMGMSNFMQYSPPDTNAVLPINSDLPSNMMLDATTLLNLRILGEDNSLYAKLNHCVTPMGKRLLSQWICSPSCVLSVIKERQKAISYLLQNQSVVQDVRAILNVLPDIERLFTKIHSLGNLNRSKNHPDSRAILYEEKTYSKRKVMEFISILNGFQSALDVMKRFKDSDSTLLQRLTQFEPKGKFPDYVDTLNFFKEAFDHQLAAKEGTMLPGEGVDTEYDNALSEISKIERELEKYRLSQERHFNCKVAYFGSDKKRYQLEIVESKAVKAGRDYHLEGTRKGYKRFSTDETKDLLARMLAAEDEKKNVLKDLSRRIFEKFTKSHDLWQKAINCISTIDVLIALSEYTRTQTDEICIPELKVTKPGEKPSIAIYGGRHPCMSGSGDFVPNDTFLNQSDTSSLVLLTGPNMGGKSTLMRQLGILTIMAQIGCHLPASECQLTLIDRIFTRLGAHDDIMTGQSTFLVELSETAAILKHATIHSLVLLDELGRGTSTYDGTAIAASVVDELSKRGCRTMFSTHYHTLVEDFKNNSNVSLAHMACMVETDESESEDSESVTQETVTFLYKLSTGACPKSYGFNAARLAGINKDITHRAHHIAVQMEKEANIVSLFKKICSAESIKSGQPLKDLISACTKLSL